MLLQFVFKSKAKIPTQTKNPTNVGLNGVISLLLVLIQSIHLLGHSQDELPTRHCPCRIYGLMPIIIP